MTVPKKKKGFELLKTRFLLYMQFKYRLITSSNRVTPDFIVLGGQKCGTTSLHRYLKQHPNVLPPYKKDSGFFDANYFRGFSWYRAYFPLQSKIEKLKSNGEQYVTGEVTTSYIHHPLTPRRIFDANLPNVKFIVLLRNPVDRAYSHYQHMVRTQRETLSFKEAIEKEDERLYDIENRVRAGDDEALKLFRNFSYKNRGRYVEQLERWFALFPKERFLILKSEDLFQQPEQICNQVFEFLGIPPRKLAHYENVNPGGYISAEAETLQSLTEYFKPYNQRLADLIGYDFGWDASQ
jgi:hypothetical protein